MERFEVTVLFEGFSGKLSRGYLGWGTWALIRQGGHNILLDTGFVGLRTDFEGMLSEQGLSPKDIDYVLLTHLHFDHGCNVDLVPDAQFVVSRAEWEYATDPNCADRFIEQGSLLFLKQARLRLVEDGEEILPGIIAMLTPGHTPGCCSYVLRQPDGEQWVLAGDALKNKGELLSGSVQMSLDPASSAASIAKIKQAGDRILPGHATWISQKGGTPVYETLPEKKLVFGQSVTINGGLSEIVLTMDP